MEYSAVKDTTFAAAYHRVLIDRKEIGLCFSCFDLLDVLMVLMVVCNENGFDVHSKTMNPSVTRDRPLTARPL